MRGFFVGGLWVAACGPPHPPGHDIEVVVDDNVVWTHNVGQPPDYAWEVNAFDSFSPVPSFTLENHTVGVRFRDVLEQDAVVFPKNPSCGGAAGVLCPPFLLRQRPELHLFERDPRQMYFALLDTFDTPWVANLAAPTFSGINTPPFELPADVVIPYGRNFTFVDPYPTPVLITSFGEQDFLAAQNGGATKLTQWELPSSGGSPLLPLKNTQIAAARVLTLPQCSTAVDVQNTVFSAVQGVIGNAIQCTHISDCLPLPTIPPLCATGEAFPTLSNLTVTTYLTHQDPGATNYPADIGPAFASKPLAFQGVIGGVLLRGTVSASFRQDFSTLPIDLSEPCAISFAYDYRYGLDSSGRFMLTPLQVLFQDNGVPLCQFVDDTIQTLLTDDIPNFASSFAASKQVVPQAPILDFRFQCDLTSTDDIKTKCGNAMETLRLGIEVAGPVLGIPTTTLESTVLEPSHWRCRPDTPDEVTFDCGGSHYSTGRCDFQLPAADVIAEPDEIRIAWPTLDDFASASPSPSTVAFVLTFASGPTAYKALCTPPFDPPQTTYRRYFATLNVSNIACHEPGPPGPLPICACSADINCVDRFGNGARCVGGTCVRP